jgi:formate dehydrogenase major subunit
LVKGDIGNDLVAISEEPNVRIMETKGILCQVARGRANQNGKSPTQHISKGGNSRGEN